MEEQISKNDTSFDDINYDSFVETQEEYKERIEKGDTGMAILKSAELIEDSDVSEPYKNRYADRLASEYIMFEAELTDIDKEIEVYCPATNDGETINTIKRWTGSDSIDGLSGSTIPVRYIGENVYRAEKFDKVSAVIPYPKRTLVNFAESGLIEYIDGSWKKSTRLRLMESMVLVVTCILLFISYTNIVS